MVKLLKKLEIPDNFSPPRELIYEEIVARPLNRSDLAEDLKAVNSNIELIRTTRGGFWPSEEISEEFDFLDLAWHEREFRDNTSFAYVVKSDDRYIGCFYLYPLGERTELSNATKDFDVDASWWVTQDAYDRGEYNTLYEAIKHWLNTEFPFKNVYYSNAEIPVSGKNA